MGLKVSHDHDCCIVDCFSLLTAAVLAVRSRQCCIEGHPTSKDTTSLQSLLSPCYIWISALFTKRSSGEIPVQSAASCRSSVCSVVGVSDSRPPTSLCLAVSLSCLSVLSSCKSMMHYSVDNFFFLTCCFCMSVESKVLAFQLRSTTLSPLIPSDRAKTREKQCFRQNLPTHHPHNPPKPPQSPHPPAHKEQQQTQTSKLRPPVS